MIEAASFCAKVPRLAFDDAILSIPDEVGAIRRLRYRWLNIVSQCWFLTPAQKQMGAALADFVNATPEHPWFKSAWMAHATLAERTALSVRTVHSSLVELEKFGLIAVEVGGGWKVPGGRTNRYSLRIDQFDNFERAAREEKAVSGFEKAMKNFIAFARKSLRQVNCFPIAPKLAIESPENLSIKMRKDCRRLYNNPSKDPITTNVGAPCAPAPACEAKTPLEEPTENDIHRLRIVAGDGDYEMGYGRTVQWIGRCKSPLRQGFAITPPPRQTSKPQSLDTRKKKGKISDAFWNPDFLTADRSEALERG